MGEIKQFVSGNEQYEQGFLNELRYQYPDITPSEAQELAHEPDIRETKPGVSGREDGLVIGGLLFDTEKEARRYFDRCPKDGPVEFTQLLHLN